MTDVHGEVPHTDRPPAPKLLSSERGQLFRAFSDIEALDKPHVRNALAGELGAELGGEFKPRIDENGDVGGVSIIQECLRLGAVRALVDILRYVAPGRDVERFAEINDRLIPRYALTPGERQSIDDALSELSVHALERLVRVPELNLSADVDERSVRQLITDLDAAAAEDRTARTRLFHLIEALAHGADDFHSRRLHAVVDHVAARLDAVREAKTVCRHATDQSFLGPDSEYQPLAAGDNDMRSALSGPATDSSTTHGPDIMGGVPPRNPNFVGRRQVFEDLSATLAHHGQAAVLPTTLRGLGGIGKSQLAAEFIRRYQNEYRLIWWIPAENPRSIRRSFVSLARRMGIAESDDVQNTVETVLDQLRLGKPYSDWLLVFDDAGEPSAVRPYLPSGPGQVLISSRLRSWQSTSRTIELDVFDAEESLEFLAARWPELTREQALDLAERLGHLPLALDQAASVHSETGMPLTEYLRLLEDSPAQILEQGTADEYPTSFAKMFELAFDQLRTHSPAAAQLLEICAFLSSNPISVPMLNRGRGARLPSPLADTMRDDLKMRGAVRDMGRYALAQLDPSRDFIKIHMLVRAVLRDKLPPDQKVASEKVAHEVLALANPGQPDNGSTWAQHAQLSPHVLPSGVIHSGDAHVRKIVLDQVRYYYVLGDYLESRDLAREALANWRGSLGPDDEMTLLAGFHLGNAARALGDYEDARAVNRDTWARMNDALGAEHEYTLRAAASSAADLRLLGDFISARDIDEDAWATAKSTLGESDPVTLRIANNLAVDFRLLGDFTRATELDEDTLRRRREVLGETNPEFLSSVSNLARDLYGRGEYARGLEEIQDVLPRFLHERYAAVILARRNQALLLRVTGAYGSALEMSESVYRDCLSRFGSRHEHTMSALTTLFNTLRICGRTEEAVRRGEEALGLYTAHFAADHPFTLACATDVAVAYRSVGRIEDAYELDLTTFQALGRRLGDDHPYTLVSGANVANDLALRREAAKACEQSVQTYERSVLRRGADHPYTLFCGVNLALDLDGVGQRDEAAQLRSRVIPLLRQRFGAEHPEIVNVERGRRAESVLEVPAT